MFSVRIEIGRGFSSGRTLLEATDEWVWMRIHELRQSCLASSVYVTIESGRANLKLGTPCVDELERPIPERCNDLELKILDLWDSMGLNDPDFTAGSAVFFVQRLRWLLDPEAVRAGMQTPLKIGGSEKC